MFMDFQCYYTKCSAYVSAQKNRCNLVIDICEFMKMQLFAKKRGL